MFKTDEREEKKKKIKTTIEEKVNRIMKVGRRFQMIYLYWPNMTDGFAKVKN